MWPDKEPSRDTHPCFIAMSPDIDRIAQYVDRQRTVCRFDAL